MTATSGAGLLFAADQTTGDYPPSYYTATANPHEAFPALDGEIRAVVCVVGGGYTGLSAALHLAERGVDVVLLEAHRVGWGASGRNGGQLGSGQRQDQDWLERVVGDGDARLLWEMSQEAKALVRDRIARHDIACDLKPGILEVTYAPPYRRHAVRARDGKDGPARAVYQAHVDHMRDRYGYDELSVLSSGEVAEAVGSPAYGGGVLDSGASHLHPLNLALGLADAARQAGARIYEHSAVTAIAKGDQVRVSVNDHTVTADTLILGCNGYLDDLCPEVSRYVMPINNFIAATEPLSEDMAKSLIRDDVAVSDSRFVIDYFRLSSDKRLLFGGGETYSYRFPSDVAALVRKPMLEIFPQLKDVQIDYAWGGTLAITANRMPQFMRPAPNIWSASGYSGHGVAMANMSGKIMADAVGGTLGQFDVMASVPGRAFPGGARLRHPLLVLAMTWYAMRDRLGV